MPRVVAAVLALLLIGCTAEDAQDAQPPEDFVPPPRTDTLGTAPREMETALPLLLTSTLMIADGGEAQGEPTAGTARLLRSAGPDAPLTLAFELNGVPPGPHPWELRAGDCAASTDADRGRVGTAGVGGTIEVGEAGFGEATALVPGSAMAVDDIGRGRYSLVVHGPSASGATSGVFACADL